MPTHFRFDDGGRTAAGYRGKAGDCVVRSIAIATGLPYQHVYDLVNRASVRERTGRRKRGKSNARTGVYKSTIKQILHSLGWVWTPTMQIGSGCTVHLRPDELPSGRLLVSVSKHLTVTIDGVIHDTHDCSRRGTRCVYGYWQPGPASRSLRNLDFERSETGVAHRRTETSLPPVDKPRRPSAPKPSRRPSLLEWLFG
jgi:hypothetical protein